MVSSQNIILIGFMGSGKTSTGKELARILNFQFLDMDQWIEEKNKKKIKTIFKENGESFFRNEEKTIIDQIQSKKNCVISTGGGAWIDGENRQKLLHLGWCVWLRVSPENAWKRISPYVSNRPLLSSGDTSFEKLSEIMKLRNPIYSLAHIQIDTDEKNPKEVAMEIVRNLKQERPFDLPPLQK